MHKVQIQWYLLLLSFFGGLTAGITFDGRSSTVRVGADAELVVGAAGLTIDGTLQHDTGGEISGEPIVFDKAHLIRADKTATITGTYDGTTIHLRDAGDECRADARFDLGDVMVSGVGSILAGDATLTSDISLAPGVNATVAVTSVVERSIVLSGATVTLDEDLFFGPDAAIKGTGTVLLNGHALHLGSAYSAALTSTLAWTNAKSICLEGGVALNGAWTFTGTNRIDGQGQTLDLGTDGRLIIAAGAKLELHDITVRGLTGAKIVFGSATSELRLSGATLHPTASITIASGSVYVAEDSTFVLRGNDLTFNASGKLTIDGSTLFLNVVTASASTAPGSLSAPAAIFTDHVKSPSAISSNILAGNLVIQNLGVVTEVNDEVIGGTASSAVDASAGGTVSVGSSVLMGPDDVISVVVDTIIDGRGATLYFSRTETPQLTVAAGKVLTLENIELSGLTDKSISLGTDAVLRIGANVSFTLASDITWTKERIELMGTTNVCTIRGSGRNRKLTFISAALGDEDDPTTTSYATHLQLNTNTLNLENISLSGLRHIRYTSAVVGDATVAGALALTGDATVEHDRSVSDFHFVVRGLGNKFTLLRSDITFDGSLTYDAYSSSELTVTFLLPRTYRGIPRIHLENAFATVASSDGQAALVFDQSHVKVRNKGAASLVLGVHSVLRGARIEVETYPIVQADARCSLFPGTMLTSALEQGAIIYDTTIFADDIRSFSAFALSRAAVCAAGEVEDLLSRRGVLLPTELLHSALRYDSAFTLPVLHGEVFLRDDQGNVYTNLRVATGHDLNLTLQDGVMVQQAATAMTLKANDIINVVGGTIQRPNCLSITANTRINGKLLFDTNAVLALDFSAATTPPVVTIARDAVLDLGVRGILSVIGEGTVVFEDGHQLNFGTGAGRIIFSQRAQLSLSDGQTFTLKGVGTLEAGQAGRFVVEDGSSLICGTVSADDITLRLHTNGSLRVGQDLNSTVSGVLSYVSFAGSTGLLDCSYGGSFIVSDYGVFECNALRNVLRRGVMKAINMSIGGSLYIAAKGAATFGENLSGMSGVSWNMLGGFLSGSGIITAYGSSLQGQLQHTPFAVTGVSSKVLVAKLIQTAPTLQYSTVFLDSLGNKKLYNLAGSIIALGANDLITSDNSDGAVFGVDTLTGELFSYTAAGVRR